jgi:hypothetical protein
MVRRTTAAPSRAWRLSSWTRQRHRLIRASILQRSLVSTTRHSGAGRSAGRAPESRRRSGRRRRHLRSMLTGLTGLPAAALDEGEAPSCLPQRSLGAVAVLHADRVDDDGQQQAGRAGQNVALAPALLLACVIAGGIKRSTLLCAPGALAFHDAHRRIGLPPRFLPHRVVERMVDARQRAVPTPVSSGPTPCSGAVGLSAAFSMGSPSRACKGWHSAPYARPLPVPTAARELQPIPKTQSRPGTALRGSRLTAEGWAAGPLRHLERIAAGRNRPKA